ncbi:MAG: hypothetical protein IKV98_03720 [Clostridia bacterium]|nr:hypothetical protein [Clostridia bacterium]
MSTKVKGEVIVNCSGTQVNETRNHVYLTHDGLLRREYREHQSQSDTSDYTEYRDSPDNGKTWGEWVRTAPKTKEQVGEDEIAWGAYPRALNVWNPVHRHYIDVKYDMIYIGGYDAATECYWKYGKEGRVIHTYIDVYDENRNPVCHQLAKYEDGDGFDRQNYHSSNYISTNIGIGSDIYVMKNGDILISFCAPVDVCCKRAGLDVSKLCRSNSTQNNAFMACRGSWNKEKHEYDLTFSDPLVLDDRQSSRGINEPIMAELSSGKILLVFRMSNVLYTEWNSRISPYAPSYKMFSISEDGGKSFSVPMPWHFDSREVIYSSATYSLFVRSEKSGKLYWFGNITDPTKTDGNMPRYPLCMVAVDDEWGCAKKASLDVIDTRAEGESDRVQLSNFGIIQDRETGNFELYLTKYGQFPEKHIRDCEVWKYTITE